MSYASPNNGRSRRRAGLPHALLMAVASSLLAGPPLFAASALDSTATAPAKAAVDQGETHPDDPQVSPLSVAPLALPAYPDDRPEWIDQPPVLSGPTHLWPVASVPSLTEDLSIESLAAQKRIAVAAYIEHVTGSTCAGRQCRLDAGLTDAHLLAADQVYSGTVITSNGVMYEHAAQLRFDEEFRQMIRQQWSDQQLSRRLSGLGMLGAGGLGVLMVMTGLLKVAHRRTAGKATSVSGD